MGGITDATQQYEVDNHHSLRRFIPGFVPNPLVTLADTIVAPFVPAIFYDIADRALAVITPSQSAHPPLSLRGGASLWSVPSNSSPSGAGLPMLPSSISGVTHA